MGTRTNGRTPTARLSDCATELESQYGVQIEVNQTCTTKFVARIPRGEQYDALFELVIKVASQHKLAVLEANDGVFVSVPTL